MDLFLKEVLTLVGQFGGLSWMAKVASVIVVIISSMKVTLFKELVWNRLGVMQQWVAPILGIAAGVLSLGAAGQLSLAGVVAYMGAGAGAVLLHELLDSVKSIPGLGPIYVSVIDFVESKLGGGVK